MPSTDYDAARKLLEEEFARVERAALEGKEPSRMTGPVQKNFNAIFESATQAYREVFLGCILARLADREIDITKPYVNQGEDAYNGRTLDEKVVNPFLHERRIPSSKGPFLAAFRRSVRFDAATREGLRDKEGYDSLLYLIKKLNKIEDEKALREVLRYTLFRFVSLRTASEIPLVRLQRISLEQYGQLIQGLLNTASGGRFPMMLAESTFAAIQRVYGLDWIIDVQGINVADKASGAGGDITIKRGKTVVLAVEVTERAVSKTRIVSTFQTKIAPQGIEDYLFLVTEQAEPEVMKQARQYFSQGHEINFFRLKRWILVILATIGGAGRTIFNDILLEKLSSADVPASLKVAWNKQMEAITAA
jgi:hypothetical protein